MSLSKLRHLTDSARPGVLDLFSGCGGFSLGFEAAGFEILAGVEADPVRARTHAKNFHPHDQARHAEARDVRASPDELLARLGLHANQIVGIIGGPPCQAYARVGRAKLREVARDPRAHLNDERGDLYKAYLRYVSDLQPLFVVMENVPDILSIGGRNVAEDIALTLSEMGYEARYTLLNAANFGVPQLRERWFLIGLHRALGLEPVFPEPTHYFDMPPGLKGTRSAATRALEQWLFKTHLVGLPEPSPALRHAVTAADALSDLPSIPEEVKMRGKRSPDLSLCVPYRPGRPTEYQRSMRQWEGFESDAGVTAHATRYLPRDYGIFAEMAPGDEYPAAWRLACRLFDREVERRRAEGEKLRKSSNAWKELRAAMVPPYDPSKFPNRWRKMAADEPARTLMAHLGHDGYTHIHYDSAEARTITVREAARLQSFPDGFVFEGAMNASFAQIGNAVPPLLAKKLATAVLASLRQAVGSAVALCPA